jgi:hypothetical protein
LFCYTVRRVAHETVSSGRVRMVSGQALIVSKITELAESVAFAVLHFGDQNITAVVKRWNPEETAAYQAFLDDATAAVNRADFPAVVRSFDRYFGGQTYSIQSLFRDEQKRILEILLRGTTAEVETSLSAIYEKQASLLHFLSQSGLPRPAAMTLAATFAINAGLRRALESEPIDAVQARSWLNLAQADQVTLDKAQLSYFADQRMKRAMVELHDHPDNPDALDNALLIARTLREMPFNLNLWQAQNLWYDVFRKFPETPPPEESLEKWKELGRQMQMAVDVVVSEESNGNGNHVPREAEKAAAGKKRKAG